MTVSKSRSPALASGVVGGYAPLDSGLLVPVSYLPVGTGATQVAAGNHQHGLVLLESHTASASATLDFAARNAAGQSGATFQSDYDTYLFQIVSLVPATNHVSLVMRMGTGGGPTYDAGANYSYDQFVWRTGGTALNGGIGLNEIALNYSNSDTIETGTAALASLSGSFYLYDPGSTALFKQVIGEVTYRDAAPFRVANKFRGAYESTTAVTALRFLLSSGNISSGVIRVYGLAKS